MDATAEIGKESSSWVLDALGELGGFAGRLVRNFLRLFLAGIGGSVLLAGVVYLAANDGLIWKGSLGAVVALVAGGIASFVLAMKLSIVFSVSDTVRAKNVGQRILDALFSKLLGVTTENPQGDLELTRKLHGISVPELEARLHQAGNALLEHRITTTVLPRFARWLANKTQQLLVWATIRVIVAYATANKTRDDTVDLLALRASLAAKVDDLLARQIAAGAFRLALFILFLFVLGSWGWVELLHRIPVGQ
jgi:hypothetical protein